MTLNSNESLDMYTENTMLNYNIATKIFKLEPCECYPPYTRYQNTEREKLYGGKWTSPIPNYINDATENNKLVEHIIKNFKADLEISYVWDKYLFFAKFIAVDFQSDSFSENQSLTKAICLSALKLYENYQQGGDI